MRQACLISGLATVVLAGFAPSGIAQADRARAKVPAATQQELIARRDAKRRAPFLRQTGWTTSLATARLEAGKRGQLIFAYFTRSFAPSPASQHLEDQLLRSPRFIALTESMVRFCHITSKVDGDADQLLMQRLGGKRFPFIVAMDPDGRPVARLEEQPDLSGLQRFLRDQVGSYTRLRDAAARGDKRAKAQFLIRRIRLGHLRPAQIQKALATADYLSRAQRRSIEQGMAGLEIREILARIDDEDPATFARAAERLVVMKKAGRIPSGRDAAIFWQVILGHADATENPELFEEALSAILKLPGVKHPAAWSRRMQLRLRALQFMKGKRRR